LHHQQWPEHEVLATLPISVKDELMNIQSLPRSLRADELNPLVFTSINDIPANPRLGLGYHQLYDPTKPVPLIARLPDVIRVGDVVTLFWDGVNVQQYDLDQATKDRGWLSFSVPPTAIAGIADRGEVYYTLFDPLAGETRYSDTRTIKVNRLVPGGLDPDTLTAINENLVAPTITPPIIDSADTPVTVTMPVWLNMELGDELTVLWNGIRVNHPPLTVIAQQIVPIPKAVLEQGGSNAKLPVSYEIRDIVDNYSLPSHTGFADVVIDPAAVAAPRVREADPVTLVLDLVALGNNDAHVLIPHYAGGRPNDQVTLTWVGRVGAVEQTLTLGPVTIGDPDFDPMPIFDIPNAHLKSIAGGTAMASYEVRHTDGTTLHSKRTAITLTGLPVSLVAPSIRGVTGTVIDLTTLGTSAFVRVAPYIGKQAGDKISLIWTGTPQNGQPSHYTDDHIVLPGEENLEYAFEVDRRLNLDPLIDGSLSLQYQVVFTGTTSPVNSDISDYTVVGVKAEREDFSGQLPALIQAGQRISRPLMDIEFVSGLGQAGFPAGDMLPVDPGPLTLPTLHVCYQNPIINPGTQTLRLDLKRDYRTVECDIHGANGLVTITLLNSNQAVIESITVPDQTNYHLRSTTTQPIRYLWILADKDWTRFDNFVLIP